MSRAAAVAIFALCACGGASGDGLSPPRAPRRSLPPYTGHGAELFDDSIEARAVGYDLQQALEPKADLGLRERTRIGDAVLRVRVLTVTSRNEDNGRSWQLGLRTIERLAGSNPPDTDFTIEVGDTDPAAGVLRTFEIRLVGMTFVAFVREFARDAGSDPELHFHIDRDGKEQVDAVKSAVLLQEVQ